MFVLARRGGACEWMSACELMLACELIQRVIIVDNLIQHERRLDMPAAAQVYRPVAFTIDVLNPRRVHHHQYRTMVSVTQSCQRVGRVGAHKATPGDDDGGMMLKMKIDDDEDVDLKVPNPESVELCTQIDC